MVNFKTLVSIKETEKMTEISVRLWWLHFVYACINITNSFSFSSYNLPFHTVFRSRAITNITEQAGGWGGATSHTFSYMKSKRWCHNLQGDQQGPWQRICVLVMLITSKTIDQGSLEGTKTWWSKAGLFLTIIAELSRAKRAQRSTMSKKMS